MIPEQIECRSYTGARRHELVAGNLGMRPKTTEQLGVGLGLFVVLYMTKAVWGGGSGFLQLVVLAAGPMFVMAALPRAQREGRSALRIVAGWVLLFTAPRYGTVEGRALRPVRSRRVVVKMRVAAR